MGNMFTNAANNANNNAISNDIDPDCSIANESMVNDAADDIVETAATDLELNHSIGFHLMAYRQHISNKQRQLMKWATSKLLLTEQLIKKQKQEELKNQNDTSCEIIDLDEYITDEESNDSTVHYVRKPPNPTVEEELQHLQTYRIKLQELIIETAHKKQSARRERKEKKIKRLGRRTLISSKKPSNKREKRERAFINKENLCFQ